MEHRTRINDGIFRLTVPYKDIFTTVCVIKTEQGAMLFDTASSAEDVTAQILPLLSELGITADSLRYVFISHHHTDHSKGLGELLRHFPNVTVLSRSPALKAEHSQVRVVSPEENDVFLNVLQAVPIPGHTPDSAAILDTRTGTLITGDCLQLSGIYGSGQWGAAITLPAEHRAAIDRLRKMEIHSILAAHDYHPYGFCYTGKAAVANALDACLAPLNRIRELIRQNPDSDDGAICNLYHAGQNLPTLATRVVAAIRQEMAQDAIPAP